jgi:hypothetical protein
MRKILIFTVLFGFACQLFSIVPFYYGARSLSLGYSGSTFNYDVNIIFLNPSMLSALPYSLSGYQYQNSYLDYKGFTDTLNEVLEHDPAHFESMEAAEKSALFAKMQDLFSSKAGFYGFSSSVPGFVARNYGISVSLVKTAIVNPVNPAENGVDLFSRDPETVTNDEIASLAMNFVGLDYKQVSFSYSMPFSQSLYAGVTLHYLNGKVTEFNAGLVGDVFSTGSDAKDYLETAWGMADEKFSKIVADLAVSMDIGKHFKVALMAKNIGSPKIETALREITMDRRIIAGLAFRPNMSWGIYVDMDIAKTDLLHNGSDMQPISIGVEKGFFQNRFFVRAGFLNDLTEKYFFGSKANALYGLGLGFNMKKFVVDVALGVDGSGNVKNLAISGFILFK